MKKILIIVLLFCSITTFAQTELVVQKSPSGLSLRHAVQPKESYYSIGRLYNIPPKDIAAFNKLDLNVGLGVGQVIQVPLNATNFSQTTNSGTPVYYVVGDKEGLYRVSVNTGNATMANLRKWNNLSNDNIGTGQKLIVGYLNAPEMNSVAGTASAPFKVKEVTTPPAVKEGPPQTLPTQNNVEKEKDVVTTQRPPATNNSTNTTTNTTTYNDAAGGYFKNEFEQQAKGASVKEQTATSGIFKTASGWQDGKYYALMDNVEPGTIVRVINPTNGKTIYAKVLGQMSGIRQNAGLELRISNAAASILDISETDKFIVRVNR